MLVAQAVSLMLPMLSIRCGAADGVVMWPMLDCREM